MDGNHGKSMCRVTHLKGKTCFLCFIPSAKPAKGIICGGWRMSLFIEKSIGFILELPPKAQCQWEDIYIYIWYPPPPRPILSNNLLLFAVFCCFFSMFKCVFFLAFFYIFKKLCRVVKALPLIKLFSFNRMIFTKPRENQKTKKPKLFRECLV